ncbi:U3 ribonucleoprotein (Utp) family protein [Galdieria sulphuraria]|uniref:U3 ribonucleoprotein (Utp) family protein n=1 Tax=Galdieria sulphuraria TaxID=130081 RepID=M2XA04_GALSU|nr:U3 ribonucleoprotein (Utp) family protein [Galdieria sulphuraria]EME26707.1 U3 ribonucleoprotein (Utp) family protein [Galdieria sulphuraria]|eukprot:XP_005703227.1 U3 ribonucleoprotein (Utp) family protein [Galdieria sulphuraria]
MPSDDEYSFSSEAQEQVVSNIIRWNKQDDFQQLVDDVAVYPKALGVTIDDLINSLHSSKKLESLKEQVSHIQGKALKPLEHRAQVERNKRKAAYEATKAGSKKWKALVHRIERAQIVDFTDSTSRSEEATTVNELVNRFQPQCELEKEIDQVIKRSLVENENRLSEELKDAKKTAEDKKDAEALRSYKAKMRALMSYFEQKRRRIKRIKSKRYRKAHRSFKGKKNNEQAKSLKETRAEERMSLRHKNTSKWVKRQLQRNSAHKEETAKAAIQEQLEIGRERMQKRDSEEEEESSDNSSSPSDEDIPQDESNGNDYETEDEMEALEESIRQEEASNNRSSEENGIALNPSQVSKKLSSMAMETRDVTFATSSRITIRTDSKGSDSRNIEVTSTVKNTKNAEPSPGVIGNPWLTGISLDNEENKQSVSSNNQSLVTHHHEKINDKNEHHHKEPLQTSSVKTRKDLIPEKQHNENHLAEDESEDDSISTNSDANENKYYLKRAFVEAGTEDNDFEREKEREIEEELEMEQPETLVLPGWGNWGGAGIKEPRASRYAEKVRLENEKKKEAAKANRKDSKRGLEHVIISEKRVKETAALTIPFVPAPMKSREEYDRTTKMPLGKEWLRFESYQRAIQPSIITPIGSNIEPINHKRVSGTQDRVRL